MRTQSLPQDMYDSLFLSGQRKTLLLSYWSLISCLLLHCPNLVLLFWCEWWMLNLWFLSLWWLVNAEMSQYKRDYWWRKQQFERLRFTAYVLMVYALLVCIGYRGGCKDFLSGYMWEGFTPEAPWWLCTLHVHCFCWVCSGRKCNYGPELQWHGPWLPSY